MTKHFKYIAYLILAMSFSTAIADDAVDFFRALNIDNDGAVSELLMRGFDPNARDPKGQPALVLAMREGSFKSAELLLKMPRLDVDAPNAAKENALMMAALKGYTEWCARLIQRGAKVDREGWTPLHYAATGPRPPAVALLLEKGAAVDARAPNGNTPLMMAAMYGQEDSVKLLLAKGADAKLRNNARHSASDLARGAGRDFLLPLLDAASR